MNLSVADVNDSAAALIWHPEPDTISVSQVITGALRSADEPDTLFYHRFDENIIHSYYVVFEKFRAKLDVKKAVDSALSELKNELEALNANIYGQYVVEAELYAARLLKSAIEQDDYGRLKKLLASSIVPYIACSTESIRYILLGWEWPYILNILLLAIAESGDKPANTLALHYSAKIVEKCIPDLSVAYTYIDIAVKTSNPDYISNVLQLAGTPVLSSDQTFADELVRKIESEGFVSRERIFNELYGSTGQSVYKRAFRRSSNNRKQNRDQDSKDLLVKWEKIRDYSPEEQIEILEKTDFTKDDQDLFSQIRKAIINNEIDRDVRCKVFIKMLDSVTDYGPGTATPENKAKFIIEIGMNSYRSPSASKECYIKDIKTIYDSDSSENRPLKVPSMLALNSLRVSDDVFGVENIYTQLLTDPYYNIWYWPAFVYLRRNQNIFAGYLRYIEQISNNPYSDELSGKICLTLRNLDYGHYVGQPNHPERMQMYFNIIFAMLKNPDISISTCSNICALIAWIGDEYSYLKGRVYDKVLDSLDQLKNIAKEKKYGNVEKKVNDLILKYDPPFVVE